ncbi:polysaccharide deacetylase family protein [Kitasatospora hibisci]|uniref:polysaccharide deacetylase family protein n=1 Tax=Kitasatospora hibisci TaxID=3369522 RepID=UPI003753FC21
MPEGPTHSTGADAGPTTGPDGANRRRVTTGQDPHKTGHLRDHAGQTPTAQAGPGLRGRLADRRGTVDALLRRSPAQPLFRLLATRRLAVLAYHGVEDPRTFALQMARLVRIARPVSPARVEQAVHDGRPLPARSVLVTFDDGDRTVLTEALPVLTRLQIPAVAFVVTEHIDGDRPFWWSEAAFLAARGGTARSLAGCAPGAVVRRLKTLPDPDRRTALAELRESAGTRAPRQEQLTRDDLLTLRRSGVAIGNHTAGHPCLDLCEDDTVRDEITRSHDALTGWLGGEAPTAFAYPNGNFDGRADALLRRLGYRIGFLFDHRHDRLLPGQALRISRLRVNSATSRDRFDTILSGLHPAVHRLRGGA